MIDDVGATRDLLAVPVERALGTATTLWDREVDRAASERTVDVATAAPAPVLGGNGKLLVGLAWSLAISFVFWTLLILLRRSLT